MAHLAQSVPAGGGFGFGGLVRSVVNGVSGIVESAASGYSAGIGERARMDALGNAPDPQSAQPVQGEATRNQSAMPNVSLMIGAGGLVLLALAVLKK